jgi:phage/plasmid-like protein (TIGR03299 family)
MAHQIENRDAQMGTFQAWHGLTDVQQEITFEKSPLNWELERRPLFLNTSLDGTSVKFHQDAIVSSDDGLPIGNAVSGSYGIIQNKDLFDTLVSGLEDCNVKFKVASIGSVCDRTKVFISIELNEGKTFMVGNRQFDFYLNALSTHDGSGKAMFLDSSICTVCANTFSFNVNAFNNKTQGIKFAVKHTKNSGLALVNVSSGIEDLISNRALFCAELAEMGHKSVNDSIAEQFLTGFVVPETAQDFSTRSRNNVEEVFNLFKTGAGNSGENRLDLFSALTDYYTHSNSGRGMQAQFVSSEFGSGSKMKTRAFSALTSPGEFERMVRRGSELALIS